MELNLAVVALTFGLSLLFPLLIAWIFFRNRKTNPFSIKILLISCAIVAFAIVSFLESNRTDQTTANAVAAFLGAVIAYLVIAKSIPMEAANEENAALDTEKKE